MGGGLACGLHVGACVLMQDLEGVVKNLLAAFKETNNGALPRRLVFYRDGVAEGQFAAVQSTEVQMIKRACASVKTAAGTPYAPPVSPVLA